MDNTTKRNKWRMDLLRTPMPTAKKTIAMCLEYRWDNDTLSCFPSYERLMEDAGVSRPTLMKYLKELEDDGWITKTRRYSKSTVYGIGKKEAPMGDEVDGIGKKEVPLTLPYRPTSNGIGKNEVPMIGKNELPLTLPYNSRVSKVRQDDHFDVIDDEDNVEESFTSYILHPQPSTPSRSSTHFEVDEDPLDRDMRKMKEQQQGVLSFDSFLSHYKS